MSEFTLNTDEVRYNYAFFLGVYSECRVAEFDRWLAKHDAEVKAEAWSTGWRQRGDMMLGLLGRYKEEIMDSANSEAENGGDPAWDIERAEIVARCIALIKGENV